MTTELAKTLIVTSIIITTLVILTGCSLFGTKNPHTEGLIIPPDTISVETPTTVEDVRG